jgi:ABC-type uncharacterized transport system permease subunit
MTTENLLAIISIALYGIASIMAIASLVRQHESGHRNVLILTSAATIVTICLLVMLGFQMKRLPAFGRFEAMACYVVAVAGAYLHIGTQERKARGIAALVLPYICIMLFLGLPVHCHESDTLSALTRNFWLGAHILTAFIGYGLFTLASILASAYLMQDHNLKQKRFGPVFERLPSLESLESLMMKQIRFAFLLLSLSIAMGVVLVHKTSGGQQWFTDPKVASTMVTWTVYAILLHMRSRAGQHGRRIALVTILGLIVVLFTFFGVDAMTDSAHNFVLPMTGGN